MDSLAWVELGLFGLGVLVSLIGAMTMIIFNGISKNIARMADSVSDLNIKMAVVFERSDNHEKRIGHLEHTVNEK
jgi:hypothetical protein